MVKTLKELNSEAPIEKTLVKCGLSLGLIFTKEECKRLGLDYKKVLILDDAKIKEN